MPLEALACGRPAVVFGEGGGPESVEHGRTGLVFHEPTARVAARRRRYPRKRRALIDWRSEPGPRRTAASVFEARIRAFVAERARPPGPRMLKFQTRQAWWRIHVAVDVAATALAWLLAYVLRFHADPVAGVHPRHQGRSRPLPLPAPAAR